MILSALVHHPISGVGFGLARGPLPSCGAADTSEVGVGTRGGMTVSTGWRSPVWACDHACGSGRDLGRALPQRLFGGVGLAGVASVCAWALCTIFAGSNSDAALAVQESPAQSVVRRSDPAPSMFEARFYVAASGLRLAAAPQPYEFGSPVSEQLGLFVRMPAPAVRFETHEPCKSPSPVVKS